MWSSERPLKPLRRQRQVTVLGKRCLVSAGNWEQFVSDLKDSLANQPDKHKLFVQLLCSPHSGTTRVRVLARTMKVLLDRHPMLIDRFNCFLPNNCKIKVNIKDEEEEDPDEQPRQRGVPRPRRQLPSASDTAATGLIKLKEEDQWPKREPV